MKVTKHMLTTDEIIKNKEEGVHNGGSPIDIGVIPNYMGINLVSVHGIEWSVREDNQLTELKIIFIPGEE